MIKQRVDEGLNDASGGQFKEYTETHKEGMRPIRSAQAMNDVVGTFQNKKPLPGYNVPEITPYALRKAESDQTWVDLGKSGLSDLLNDPARKSMDDSIAVMNAIEMARQGPKGVDNSMTASYLSGLASKALLAGNSKSAFVLRGLAALGESKGSKALNQALLDPMSGNLEKYLKLYGKHALPPDEININKLARILTQTSAIQANNKTRDR
jgi:hypothetical protein